MPKAKRTERAEARRFAVILASMLALIAVLSWWRHHPTRALVLVTVAGVASFLAFLFPALWTRIFRLWMKIAMAISWVVTRVLLGLLFYGFITPYGLISRMLRKDPLDLNWKRRAPTYWIDRSEDSRGLERYERPF
jgi:hypothetical protein